MLGTYVYTGDTILQRQPAVGVCTCAGPGHVAQHEVQYQFLGPVFTTFRIGEKSLNASLVSRHCAAQAFILWQQVGIPFTLLLLSFLILHPAPSLKPYGTSQHKMSGAGSKTERKTAYFEKLKACLDKYQKVVVVGADNVGSNQMQKIRQSLRGNAEVLMGKNVCTHLLTSPSSLLLSTPFSHTYVPPCSSFLLCYTAFFSLPNVPADYDEEGTPWVCGVEPQGRAPDRLGQE